MRIESDIFMTLIVMCALKVTKINWYSKIETNWRVFPLTWTKVENSWENSEWQHSVHYNVSRNWTNKTCGTLCEIATWQKRLNKVYQTLNDLKYIDSPPTLSGQTFNQTIIDFCALYDASLLWAYGWIFFFVANADFPYRISTLAIDRRVTMLTKRSF